MATLERFFNLWLQVAAALFIGAVAIICGLLVITNLWLVLIIFALLACWLWRKANLRHH